MVLVQYEVVEDNEPVTKLRPRDDIRVIDVRREGWLTIFWRDPKIPCTQVKYPDRCYVLQAVAELCELTSGVYIL